jgi:hypothetical protein
MGKSVQDGFVVERWAEHEMVVQVFNEAMLMEPAQYASQCKRT